MPKFRFEISNREENAIFEQDLPSEAAAGERAVELASETASADSTETARTGSSVRVYDDAGYLVAAVNITDLLGGGIRLKQKTGG